MTKVTIRIQRVIDVIKKEDKLHYYVIVPLSKYCSNIKNFMALHTINMVTHLQYLMLITVESVVK